MQQQDIILLLRSLPIEQVAERLGIDINRHKSLCPFHDDHHASLTYNLRRNTFRCFVCDAHGGTIDLVMLRLHKTFPEACRWLANSHNVIINDHKADSLSKEKTAAKPFDAKRYMHFFEHPWLSDRAKEFLFTERRIDQRVVRWCRLTSWQDRQGTHWLQIPYFDQEGKLIGLQNRNLDYGRFLNTDSNVEQPRFRFPYGAKCSIYNLPVLRMLRPQEPLFITEGASDCWAMLSAGHKAIAIPSATLLSRSDRQLLTDLQHRLDTTFHMYPDRDLPGETLFMQLKEAFPTMVRHHLPPDCKDFAEKYINQR